MPLEICIYIHIWVYSISYDDICVFNLHTIIWQDMFDEHLNIHKGFLSAHSLEGRHLHDRQSSTLSSHGLFRTLGRRDFFFVGLSRPKKLRWLGTPWCFDAPGGREAFLPVEHMLPRTEASTNAVRATVPRLVVLLMDTSWWLPVVD